MRTSDKYYVRDQILALLEKKSPMSMREMEKKVGLSYQRIRTAIKEMRELERPKIHISEWRSVDAYHMIAFFSLGHGKDAPRPPKTPKIVLSRRSRENAKKRKIAKEAEIVKSKVSKELDRPAFRHPQDVAFFGPPPAICPTAFRGNRYVQPMEVEEELEAA